MDKVPADDVGPVDETSLRQTYSPPVLILWGTLRDITQSVGNQGGMDGGMGMQQNRTR